MRSPIGWMAGSSVASWLVLAALAGRETAPATFAGMVGPLVVAAGSWILMAGAFRREPGALTPVMMGAFAAKLVLVAAYAGVMLWGFRVRPVPFIASFAGYLVLTYAIEALCLHRLFAGGAGASR